MWSTETIWFDLAIFAFGNVLFGHFEEHRSKIRRVAKIVLLSLVVTLLSMYGLRWVGFVLLGLITLWAVYIHAYWLPKNGVSGWTGEPRERYYDLLEVPKERRPR